MKEKARSWGLSLAFDHPIAVMAAVAVICAAALAQFPRIKVDTDPENMLPADAPVRVFHHEVKKEFSLYEFIVLGIVNESDPDGVFNPQTLGKVARLTREIQKIDGVISQEVMAPSTRDNVTQAGPGTVRFQWLMERPPATREEARRIRDEALDHPVFRGTIVSEDGRALAIYVPIERKDRSYEIAEEIRSLYRPLGGPERYYITGLPVAEDQFGAEMFKQMAVSAPLAGLVILLLMRWFFKSWALIVAPMLLAVATVITTMGLLIGLGLPVHIMSSMIPIFLMPIAVLDSVHILSEFFDLYPRYRDRRRTLVHVYKELFRPMLFTSLTSAVGFFSLSFSPIPPVQVFGILVAVGVAIAWILTMLFIPAYIMRLGEGTLRRLAAHRAEETSGTLLDRFLAAVRSLVTRRHRGVLVVTVVLSLISLYGISRIRVNDNPVRWFSAGHPLRVADRILNAHFGGTYEAYLVLEGDPPQDDLFKRPEVLRYVSGLQADLAAGGLVGKSTSLADVVKKIYDELLGGDKTHARIPDSEAAVAQCLISFENSHRPDDLWHLVTPDYRKLNIWLQLTSGDNRDMEAVVRRVDRYFREHRPPVPLRFRWAGMTYINVVWQNNMVVGMLKNFAGSFVIVLFMMLFLFRSPVKALVSMIPLSVTILFIYGLLGFFGKDYDMPVAVLSALTLGLSIDFAIHFIQRAIEIQAETGSWPRTAETMFAGPGRAIVRNALVVAVGFLPLLAAPLVPYKTVGFFMFTIMAVSSVATLFILPALVTLRPQALLEPRRKGAACRCGSCVLTGSFVALAVAYVLAGYTAVGWTKTTFAALGVVAAASGVCWLLGRRPVCRDLPADVLEEKRS